MTGHEYANLVGRYIFGAYASRGVQVFREISLGKSIIGKNRAVDILVLDSASNRAFAIECKYQGTSGTVDEKIPYALADMDAMWIPGVVAYAGVGFSDGVVQMLRASKLAAYCFPDEKSPVPSINTRELDHIIASVFGWWDIILRGRTPIAG